MPSAFQTYLTLSQHPDVGASYQIFVVDEEMKLWRRTWDLNPHRPSTSLGVAFEPQAPQEKLYCSLCLGPPNILSFEF